jgi:pilus assembly protein CpaE
MVAPIRIVALGYGLTLSRRVERACQAEEDLQFLGAAQDPQELLARPSSPEVILIHGQVSDEEGLWLIQEVTTSLPRAAVIVLVEGDQMDFIQRALMAGARGFLLQPFTDAQLRETVRRIHRLEVERISRLTRETTTEEASKQGEILAIFSPKGGVGRTTIASNLAVALQQTGRRVALMDANLQFGDVSVVLNLHARATITSLVHRVEEIDSELLMEALIPHSSGIRVLLGPSQLEETDAILYPQAIRRILTTLQQQFDYVLIDTWPFLDETTLTILDMADRILLVVTPEMPALHEVKQFLELSDILGYPPSKLLLVLNRAMSAFGIGAADIEEHIRYKIAINIPSEGPLVTRALNRGVPVVIGDPQSEVAQRIVQLAGLLMQQAEELDHEKAKRPVRLGGLTPRLRPLLASQ